MLNSIRPISKIENSTENRKYPEKPERKEESVCDTGFSGIYQKLIKEE